MRRPVVAVRTPIVKASRVPVIVATTRKRKRRNKADGLLKKQLTKDSSRRKYPDF